MRAVRSGLQRILGLALLLATASTAAQPVAAAPDTVSNCRYGITVTNSAARYDLTALGAGGYLDWRLSPTGARPAGLDYVHVVRLRGAGRRFVYDPQASSLTRQFEKSLRVAVGLAPGQAWLVGNEPDTTFEGQDSVTADQYALAYHNIYRLIKSADPTAQVGIGTIVQPTPLRLQWLEAMWAAYRLRYQARPPSDFWSIHSFILREKAGDWGTGIPTGLTALAGELYTLEQTDDLAIFSQRLIDFRRWLRDQGERAKPLWITEYGSLLPHDGKNGLVTQTPERARDYMLATFKFLSSAADPETGDPADANHLVQRWFWYSLDDNLWRFGGSLYDPATRKQTVIGEAFARYVQASQPQARLQLTPAVTGVFGSWPRVRGDPILARLTVSNAGEAPATQPLTVTWYDGDPANQAPALAVSRLAGPLAGCGASQTLSAWLPFPSRPGAGLFARLESADLAQPLTIRLSDWAVRPGPP